MAPNLKCLPPPLVLCQNGDKKSCFFFSSTHKALFFFLFFPLLGPLILTYHGPLLCDIPPQPLAIVAWACSACCASLYAPYGQVHLAVVWKRGREGGRREGGREKREEEEGERRGNRRSNKGDNRQNRLCQHAKPCTTFPSINTAKAQPEMRLCYKQICDYLMLYLSILHILVAMTISTLSGRAACISYVQSKHNHIPFQLWNTTHPWPPPTYMMSSAWCQQYHIWHCWHH